MSRPSKEMVGGDRPDRHELSKPIKKGSSDVIIPQVEPVRTTEIQPETSNSAREAAPNQETPRFNRVDLSEVMESGIDPPEMLVQEVLYAGRVHCIFSAGGTGKTYLALYLIGEAIEQGRDVLLLDLENGIRIIGERLKSLGVDSETVRKHLHYYPFPSLPLSLEATEDFEGVLEDVKPDLVVVDSWINCISAAGLDENSSTDIARWTDAYPQRARQRGIAVLLLDHVPKEGNTARGSGRKLDYVDAMWELRNPQKFDRETVGRIDLHLRKDREGWLPKVLTYSVGAGDEGFIFERSLGTVDPVDEYGLHEKERRTLEALKDYGQYGAKSDEWKETANTRSVGRSKFYEAKKKLLDLDLVHKVMDKYFVNSLQNAWSSESSGPNTGPNGPRCTRESSGSSTPRNWTTGPTAGHHPQDCLCAECVPV